MKIYCEKCKSVFEAERPESGAQTVCPKCGAMVNFPETPTSPGAVIGDFLIEREISKGGMGEVFLARQLSLDRPVALKQGSPSLSSVMFLMYSSLRASNTVGSPQSFVRFHA